MTEVIMNASEVYSIIILLVLFFTILGIIWSLPGEKHEEVHEGGEEVQ